MKTQTETFRGYAKIAALAAQTAVECRFPQEVETVLSVHASATLTGADAGNGEVRYYGKAHFSVVYEDAEKRLCRAEKAVEWAADCKDERCYPALAARAQVAVENVSVRREGASVFVTALLGADIALYGEQSFEYLAGGEIIVNRTPANATVAHLCGGAAETDDEFETEFIGDIMQHTQAVNVTDVVCETGSLRVEGEINLGILALKGGDALVSFERLVPFRFDIPCEACSFGCSAQASVSVLSVSIKADADEERGRCRINAEFTLSAQACVYEEITLDAVGDAFSLTNELTLTYADVACTTAADGAHITERVTGRAALSAPVDFTDVLQAVTCQRAEANLTYGEGGQHVEGVALATLLMRGKDGCRGIEISLPFSIPVEGNATQLSVLVCGMSARQKQEGEIDAEATLKICLREERESVCRIVCGATEGAAVPVNDSAISVYIPRAGDGLWELAKSLKKPPEEVAANNPDIEFPVKEGQRVIVYRKKTLQLS